LKKLVLAVVLALIIPLSLYSFQFEPIVSDIEPSGTGSRRTYIVTNPGDSPLPVKVSISHRVVDIHGRETLQDASDLFLIYPPQFIVQPRSSQSVRVQWRGPSTIERELPFRIVAEQLPLTIEQEQSGVRILLVYKGSLYVVPPTFQYGIKVNSVSRDTRPDGEAVMLIELENTGNTHIILEDPILNLTVVTPSGAQRSFELIGDTLTGLANENLLAGNRRIFTLQWPEGIQSGELHATISIDPQR